MRRVSRRAVPVALLLLPLLLGRVRANAANAAACADDNALCPLWADHNECLTNPFFMRQHCRRACGACAGAPRSQTWPGHATELGTRHFATMLPSVAQRTAGHFFRRDPSMGAFVAPGQRIRGSPWLTLSSVGTGTYLGDEDAATDEAVASAVIMAVSHGLNVIDTASNYRGGRGERAVGAALGALLGSRALGRAMLFVSTKAGFLAPDLRASLLAGRRVREADVAGGHCLAPACLDASLQRSLAALRLKTVDVLYLHNVAEARAQQLGTPAFWAALERAFRWAEGARAEGRLRAYGLATWACFRTAPDAPGHLSLRQVVALAERVGGRDHGFRYVQLPVNAGMLEAAVQPWQPGVGGRRVTLLRAAAEAGVGVFASGPLGEGSLLADASLEARLSREPQLAAAGGLPAQLLQLARSAPLLLGAVVGHKSREHVLANAALASVPPLDAQAFERAAALLAAS